MADKYVAEIYGMAMRPETATERARGGEDKGSNERDAVETRNPCLDFIARDAESAM